MNGTSYIKIAVIDNIIEAQMIESALAAENIPYRMRSFHDTAYDGLFQFQKGFGEISAPEQFKETILEIISNIKEAGEMPSKDPNTDFQNDAPDNE